MARLPNVPTVWSNVFTAWVLSGGVFATAKDHTYFALVLLGGTFLYVSGTLFNDVADVNFDREHRPERPIPSGRVPRGQVGGAAAVLMLCGTAAFLLLGNYFSIFLPLVILVYTYIHKTIPPAGLLFMASCRLLLAITVSFSVPDMQLALTGIIIPNDTPAPQFWWWTLFAYICALSWLAQGEKRPWRRKTVGVMLAALPLLDAVFMLGGGQGMLPLVPVACAAMAWGLRRVASAT